MANLLGVTNPVPGYESTNTSTSRNMTISPNDTSIRNIPDATRVNRPDARSDQQDSAGTSNQQQALRYDSNLQSFIQRLNSMPELVQTLTRILSGKYTQVSSGVTEGLAEQMAQLLDMIPMNESELLGFLKEQVQSGSRFGGALFTILRDAASADISEDMRTNILQFSRLYSEFSSTEHIEGNILRSLQNMADSMPASWASKLIEYTGQFENGVAVNDRAGNLNLLFTKIFPYMSGYISRTHDMGAVRSYLTMLTLDTVRYESGSEQNLLNAFHQLQNSPILRDKLQGIDDQALLQLLGQTEFAGAAEKNRFASQFAEAATHALRGEGGNELQSGFQELVQSVLVHESVYMPVNHYLIPLQWDDKVMYSEMWVDPDADSNTSSGGGESTPRTLRFLFKMDIQGLGTVDVILANREQQVDMQVYCPTKAAPFSRQIETAMRDILTRNGFEPGTVQVDKAGKPVLISSVFPKLFEGKGGVNVKI